MTVWCYVCWYWYWAVVMTDEEIKETTRIADLIGNIIRAMGKIILYNIRSIL